MSFRQWLNMTESLSLKGDYKYGVFQRLVAAAYQLSPTRDDEAIPAFLDLAKKINRQKDYLDSKYEMRPSQNDPYKSMKAMTRDIERQKNVGVKKPVISVYAEPPALDGNQKGHPVFSNDDNVTQRGVHDIIAHYFGKHPFSARGEIAAYNRHLKTLCNTEQVKGGNCLAAQAMFTEVVGQTSYYYVYGTFAEQKAVILGDFDHARIGQLSAKSRLNAFFTVTKKDMVKRPDFTWSEFEVAEPRLADELLRQQKVNLKLLPIA